MQRNLNYEKKRMRGRRNFGVEYFATSPRNELTGRHNFRSLKEHLTLSPTIVIWIKIHLKFVDGQLEIDSYFARVTMQTSCYD